jgi:hypothetical protein
VLRLQRQNQPRCLNRQNYPERAPVMGETGQNAYVDEIDVLILESFPVQVNVVVRGNLPDGCTYLDEFDVVQDGNTFNITVWTIRDPDAMCTMALVPFEETVSLDVEGLPAGEYTGCRAGPN